MPVLTPVAACLIFVGVVVIAAIVAYIATPEDNKSKIQIFITTLAGLGIFLTFMFYYNLVTLQQDQQTLDILQQTHAVNDSILGTYYTELRKSSSIIPHFTLSLLPFQPQIAEPDPVTPVTIVQKGILSSKIFFIWQDFLLSNTYLSIDDRAYINDFLQLASSTPLKEMWEVKRYDYGEKTIIFGDLLFLYTNKIEHKTPDDYNRTAKELVKDPVYIKLTTVKKPWLFA